MAAAPAEFHEGKNPMAVFVFHGEDQFSAREEISRLRAEYLSDDTAGLNYSNIDGSKLDFDALAGACEAFPFMASYRVVVVENLLSRLSAPKNSPEEDGAPEQQAPTGSAAQVVELIARLPDQTILIFADDKKLDSRNQILKAAAKAGEVREFVPKKGPELQKWIKERAKAQRFKIAEQAVSKLADFIGGDLYSLSRELEKLAAYAGPGGSVGATEVALLVPDVSESMIWDLTDSIVRKNAARALDAARSLVGDGRPIPWILTKIADHFRQLILVKEGLAHGWSVPDVMRELKIKEYPAKKAIEQSRGITMASLESVYPLLIDADISLKTRRTSPEVALEVLITKICSRN
jgi:DNA polymerase III subunit delta